MKVEKREWGKRRGREREGEGKDQGGERRIERQGGK